MNRFSLAFLLLVLAGTLAACGDDNAPAGPDGVIGEDVVTSAAVTRNAALLAELTGTLVAVSTVGLINETPASKAGGVCPDIRVDVDPRTQEVTVLLDAGDGCLWNDRVVSGVAAITVQQGQNAEPTTATAAFNAFTLGGRGVTGTVTTTYTFSTSTATGTATADLTVEDELSVSDLDADFNVVVQAGRPLDLVNTSATLWGTAEVMQSGTTAADADLTVAEGAPLNFSGDCAFPRAGLMQAAVTSSGQSLPTVTVDFAPVGSACDSIASIIVGNRPAQTVDFMALVEEN